MKITLPELSLVVLIGASGSGKSTFARKHFQPFEVLSSDTFRGLVSNDENDQSATPDAFDALYAVLEKRLKNGLLTVIDATNVRAEDRMKFLERARKYHLLPAAIVLNLPESVCFERNVGRPDRQFGAHVVRTQSRLLRGSLRVLSKEGFRPTYVLSTLEDVENASLERQPLWTNKKHLTGPFDFIGDVHGCAPELSELLGKLGYALEGECAKHPDGRTAVFVGDLVDRGPDTPGVLRRAMAMVAAGNALCVAGNHDDKLKRALEGREVSVTHGLEVSLAQLEGETPEFRAEVATFLDGLLSHYTLDGGKLTVAHAGLPEHLQGRASRAVREFALYGEVSGEKDAEGLPIRLDWAADYHGKARVIYGHTPVMEPQWKNRTLNIDTGCVYGGKLSALRYPELELVSVAAQAVYAEGRRFQVPLELDSTMLDLSRVLGKQTLETRLAGRITVREENAAAALETMSRFAIDPRMLIYLPPTLSPVATSSRDGLLEHPDQAFAYYREQGIERVVCQEKHMGSRLLALVGRDPMTFEKRFGVQHSSGVLYTRTGRRFFQDEVLESAILERLRAAATGAKLWDALETDWLLLDAELMPWSAKAQELLTRQYAPVGAAGRAALSASVGVLERAAKNGVEVSELLERTRGRMSRLERYTDAYGRYCWPTDGLEGLKLAPFHLLGSEGAAHFDKPHSWHLEQLDRLARADTGFVQATERRWVDLNDDSSVQAAVSWWENLTAQGGEGMVVKPLEFVPGHRVQPALKVRGPEYLRIIYGPEYDAPENLSRLRSRGLGAKRSLALREFALGVEALERFVRHDSLSSVHEAVFAALSLESEPIDPRL